jgi:prepilin-type processing-associated H-X9-DG protein
LNRNIEGLGFNAPGDMVLLFESRPGWNLVGGPEILTTDYHQQEGCNVVFVDGHTAFIKSAELAELRWTVNPRAP